jgi:hypothetical protein
MSASLPDVTTLLRVSRESELRVSMVSYSGAYTDRAPAVEVTVTPDVHNRNLGAVMFVVAAFVEAGSYGNEWEVELEEYDRGQGRVVLLLGTECNSEAAKALKLLQQVVATLRGPARAQRSAGAGPIRRS